MIVALAGGVGGARLAVGLAAVLPPPQLAIVVNTGDDFEHLGLAISPDLDTVMYTLAGVNNPVAGWGRAQETWSFMSALAELGGDDWFRLGDRDLAMHVLRTLALRRGVALSAVTRELAGRLGIRHALIPMSDAPVRTRVLTARGVLAFQDYFVRDQCRPRVRGFRFAGSRKAQPATAARTDHALAQGARRRNLPVESVCQRGADTERAGDTRVDQAARFPGGRGVADRRRRRAQGPGGENDARTRCEATALGIARHYGGLVDGWVIDTRDAKLQRAIEQEGKAVMVTDTVMQDRGKSRQLAQRVVSFAHGLS